MKTPFEFEPNRVGGTLDGRHPPLRVLLAERPGGRLSQLVSDFPITLPIDFEVEDHLAVVASLGAQNMFDIIVIGESLMGRDVDPEVVRSLAEASHTTPILILGSAAADGEDDVQTGSLRMVSPPRISASVLLREIRQTLEMHVTAHLSAEQQRRIACLGDIFDHLIEHMPYAVAVMDQDGDICSLNTAASALWHQPASKLIGSHLLDDPAHTTSCIVAVGPGPSQVEVAPVPIQWLGHPYFLTSLRRVRPGA